MVTEQLYILQHLLKLILSYMKLQLLMGPILKRIWYIDLPSIVPTAVIMLILRTSNILSVGFEKVYLLQKSAQHFGIRCVISTYVYNIGLLNMQYSFSTAIGFMQFISLFLVVIVNKISEKLPSQAYSNISEKGV